MSVVEDVFAELQKATLKFPLWPTDPFHALSVVGEEYGELQKAVLQHCYEKHKGVSLDDIREEALQLAAMGLRFALSLDSYAYSEGAQHQQGVAL